MSTFVPPPYPPVVPVPEYLLRVAQAYPDREVVLFLRDTASEEGVTVTSVSWRQFLSDAWNRSEYLRVATGLKARELGDEPFTVGLLAENNYLFLVTLTAMYMLRWAVLLISVRNSPDAIRHLARSTGSTVILVDEAISQNYSQILGKEDADASFTATVIDRQPLTGESAQDGMALLEGLLRPSQTSSSQALQNEARTPCFYLHTSGTSGHPKAVTWSHEVFLALTASHGRDRAGRRNNVLYTCFPLFHGSAISTSLPIMLGCGGSFVCLDSWGSVSADAVLRHLRILMNRRVDAYLPPSVLEDIADSADPLSIATLREQQTILWGGAPLRDSAGNYLTKRGVRLISYSGMTEVGLVSRISLEPDADPADWSWIRLIDAYEFKFSPIEGDTRHSLTVLPLTFNPPVVNSHDPLGHVSSDAWMRHPDPAKSYLWKPVGRLDDVTVLSNGEKTDNKQLETLLCDSPLISHAIVFGTGRFVNGVIVSPPPLFNSSDDVSAYLDAIWPHVDGYVNHIVPQHSRLLRGMVLVARKDRPFLMSDKATVKTQASLALYANEVNKAYKALESGIDSSQKQPIFPSESLDEASVFRFVQVLVADVMGRELRSEDDFFREGMDSLLATKLRTSAIAALRRAGLSSFLPRNVTYAHSTPVSFARYLHTFAHINPDHVSDAAPLPVPHTAIDKIVSEYSAGFPLHCGEVPLSNDGDVYAVTGTTGSLGATFMSHLLEQPQTKRIYLMNRGDPTKSMAERHKASLLEKGLSWTSLDAAVMAGRAVYLEVDVAKVRLGLERDVYTELTSHLTHVVHTAWLLDFNLFLHSFVPHIIGVRNLLDLALSSILASPPSITFMSSIGVVGQWPFSDRPVPEEPLSSAEFCLSQGYSHAKYASEKIIQNAARHCPQLCATIVRCGQLSGSLATGAWARTEYIPRLMRGSVSLSKVPVDLPAVRWLPVNIAAQILYRQVEHSAHEFTGGKVTFYNLENAKPTPWSLVVDAVSACSVQPVTAVSWLKHVRSEADNPAHAVVDYLEHFVARPVPTLDMTRARCAAGDLVDSDVGEDIIKLYVEYACAPGI